MKKDIESFLNKLSEDIESWKSSEDETQQGGYDPAGDDETDASDSYVESDDPLVEIFNGMTNELKAIRQLLSSINDKLGNANQDATQGFGNQNTMVAGASNLPHSILSQQTTTESITDHANSLMD